MGGHGTVFSSFLFKNGRNLALNVNGNHLVERENFII